MPLTARDTSHEMSRRTLIPALILTYTPGARRNTVFLPCLIVLHRLIHLSEVYNPFKSIQDVVQSARPCGGMMPNQQSHICITIYSSAHQTQSSSSKGLQRSILLKLQQHLIHANTIKCSVSTSTGPQNNQYRAVITQEPAPVKTKFRTSQTA